jgi:CheY-like chemotaxis protein
MMGEHGFDSRTLTYRRRGHQCVLCCLPMRVLLIEDDPGIQMLLQRFLIRQGCTVVVVSDGEAALRTVKSETWDVVLLDLMMPKLNGFELIDQLRQFAPTILSRTIVLTAASEAALRGFDSEEIFKLIRKPFDLSDLAQSMTSCAALQA